MKTLNPKIINYIAEKLERDPKTVQNNIYSLQRNYGSLTKNAVAEMYARKKGLSVFRVLDKEDRLSLPSIESVKEKIRVKIKDKKNNPVAKTLFKYETEEYFVSGHIQELNKALTYGCFTAVFILFRKIVENLIIDILRAKYPEKVSKENKELYFDMSQNRYKDFSIVLKNLYQKRLDFGSENKAIERLYNLVKPLKDDVNDKTHSWYHLVKNPKEIDNLNAELIIEVIKKLEKAVGIR